MQLRPRTYRKITIGALVALSTIVITGAAVRLTGAGLGCVDWPNCNNQRLIDVSTPHAAIEQLNRLFTGVVALAVIAAVLGSLIRVPRRRDLTWLSLGLVAGVIAQVVLGGITVLVELHPVAVQGHFLLSMVLIANSVVLVRRSGEEGDGRRVAVVDRAVTAIVWVVAILTTVALITGTFVTGTGPHAGDPESPRFGYSISDVARVHGISVIATIAAALVLVVMLGARPSAAAQLRRVLSAWMLVAVLQAGVGYVQYFSGVPELLVAVHILGATLLTIVTVNLVVSTRAAVASPVPRAPNAGAKHDLHIDGVSGFSPVGKP